MTVSPEEQIFKDALRRVSEKLSAEPLIAAIETLTVKDQIVVGDQDRAKELVNRLLNLRVAYEIFAFGVAKGYKIKVTVES